MNPRFVHYLKIVALVHIALVAVWIGFTVARGFLTGKNETVIPVEFVVESPALHQPATQPPEIKPPQSPEPRPPERKIEVSQKTVVRRSEETTEPKIPDAEEIKRILSNKEPRTVSPTVSSEHSRCMALIKQTLRSAWAQPSAGAAGDSVVQAKIKLDHSGKIVERSLTARSGNPVMDESVMEALQAVDRIKGLSREFLRNNRSIPVSFRVLDPT
ncbi:MAG: TonB C-terminal domain-containing protein [Kiritimatiellia bacterium]